MVPVKALTPKLRYLLGKRNRLSDAFGVTVPHIRNKLDASKENCSRDSLQQWEQVKRADYT